ncbi:MAG TPA: RcnB family protein [Brevundimonas sp.]|jgi:Ni/Co efflux regulator RcnB
MKKFVTTAIAAAIAAGSLGLASTASAQSHGNRQEHRQEQRQDDRQDRREHRQDARDDRREDRRDARDDRREYRQDQRAYSRYQRAERRYNAGRWQQPRGTRYQVYGYGQRLPSSYNSYVVSDYNRYGLRAPPRGYHYVRNGNDVVLAGTNGGLITAVIAGLFN